MAGEREVLSIERALADSITPTDESKRAMCPACGLRWGCLAFSPYSLCPSCRTDENMARLPPLGDFFNTPQTLASDTPRWERAGWDMTHARRVAGVSDDVR